MKFLKNKFQLPALVLITQIGTGAFAQEPRPPVLEPPPSPRHITQQAAQQPQKPDHDIVRITTNLVQVDAVVTDKNGKVVTDLKPEEVEISEDGRAQKITNFSYVVTETPATNTRPKAGPSPKVSSVMLPTRSLKREEIKRTVALVVDDLRLSFESTYYVRRALKKFVDEQMQAGDLVAIIRSAGGMGALQQFTSDKRQLYAAIERVRYVAHGRAEIGAFPVLTGLDSMPDRSGGVDPSAIAEDVDRFRTDVLSVGTMGALGYVVKGLRELPGRKSLVLVSDGFSMFDPGNLLRNRRVLDAVRSLVDQANRAAVVINTIDARGLQTLGLTAADNTRGMRPDQTANLLARRQSSFSHSQDGLRYLAQETGGTSLRNNNDLSAGIRKMINEPGYYLIGYRPDESTFDARKGPRTFHRLSLRVNRPGKYNVRMRNGFYGVTDAERQPFQETPFQRMQSALASPFGAPGVRLQLTSLFTNDASNGSLMRSMLHIDTRNLTFTDEPDGWHKCVFDIIAVTFGDNGVPIDHLSLTHTVRSRGETFKRQMREGFIYVVKVPVKKPGAYQLRIALRDNESDRIGSASQFIDIPDLKKDRLVLSSLVLSGLSETEYRRLGGSTEPGATDTAASAKTPAVNAADGEGVEEGDAQASPAVRKFRQGMVMQYGYLIFNPKLNKSTRLPQVVTQVRLVRDGQVIFTGNELPLDATNQPDLKRLTVGGAVQFGPELIPGEYSFQIIVTDPLASEKRRTVTQWMDFEIVK